MKTGAVGFFTSFRVDERAILILPSPPVRALRPVFIYGLSFVPEVEEDSNECSGEKQNYNFYNGISFRWGPQMGSLPVSIVAGRMSSWQRFL